MDSLLLPPPSISPESFNRISIARLLLRNTRFINKKIDKQRFGISRPSIVTCSVWKRGPRDPGSSSSSSRSMKRWDDKDDDYIEAHVLEAVSILPSNGQLFMGLPSGHEIEVEYVNPARGPLLFRGQHPSIFLEIDDGSNLLLPIVVGDMAVSMLMKALHGNEKTVRPNSYYLMKNIIHALDYEVRMIRVTERVMDTYYSRIYIGKPDGEEMQSVDARPSDAINLAVRCNVPIYINKTIVAADAVKPVWISHDNLFVKDKESSLDGPESGPDFVAKEITLLKNMLLAVVEERYFDAAHWRDELRTLRVRKHLT